MKIKSNLSHNFLTIYGEARGIARNKKLILRYKKNIYINYYMELIIRFLSLVVLGYYFFFSSNPLISLLAFVFLVAVISVYICKVVLLVFDYEHRFKNRFISSIIVDERGIIDESFYDIKMLFKWKKIKAVVVSKHSVTILTDTPVYFFFNKVDSKKIIKTIEMFNKKVLIIK